MVREDLVASAVTFLQDPGVASSPLDKRIAFLQSKNLTPEEVEAALARAGENPASVAQGNASNYGHPSQQMMRQQPPGAYGGYPGGYWQPGQAPDVPRRDWRDWFIMATVVGGVGYGLFFVAKRYIYPLIAPPTTPQLEADKASIDESFNKAFALLDQLQSDTEALKASEQSRTQHLDTALQDVDTVVGELKDASRRREDEARRINDEIRGLRDLIPRAMEAHKETTDTRLKELNAELKSLKTLVGNRMGSASSSSGPSSGSATTNGTHTINGSVDATESSALPATARKEPATPSAVGGGGTAREGRSINRAAIPAWQMAASASSAAKSTEVESQAS